jgi:hypothetical protein
MASLSAYARHDNGVAIDEGDLSRYLFYRQTGKKITSVHYPYMPGSIAHRDERIDLRVKADIADPDSSRPEKELKDCAVCGEKVANGFRRQSPRGVGRVFGGGSNDLQVRRNVISLWDMQNTSLE